MRLVIIADDVTGAADTAARAFAVTGQARFLATHSVEPLRNLPEGVTAISCDSRHLTPDSAKLRVAGMLSEIPFAAGDVWFKKIDSTLRGNIGAEIDAVDQALAQHGIRSTFVVSPGFPQQNRGMRDAMLVLRGTVRSDRCLPQIIAAQSGISLEHVPLEVVRSGDARLRSQLNELQAAGVRCVTIDGETSEDLERIVRVSAAALSHPCFCGSAGLLHAVAQNLTSAARPAVKGTVSGSPSAAVAASVLQNRNVLFVSGSASDMAHEQIDSLMSRNDVLIVRTAQEARSAVDFSAYRAVAVCHPVLANALSLGELRRHAKELAVRACGLAKDYRPGVLVLAGGDTAACVLEELNCHYCEVVAELSAGIPLCTATSSKAGHAGNDERSDNQTPYVIAFKSGNHGSAETLLHLLRVFDSFPVVSNEKTS